MIELQLKLMGDKIRNAAFYDALKKVIKKGKTTVADIGSGTGFLAFLASKLGAKTCYLYEYSELIDLSRDLAGINGIKNCHFIGKHSSQVKKPVPVDVIISETLGNYSLEENIIENMRDAKRFLKPGGTVIPQKIEQFIAPITHPRVMKGINIWDDIGFGIDFSPAKEIALNNMFVSKITPADLLNSKDAIKKWDTADFRKHEKSIRSGKALWKMDKNSTVYGFCIWWEAELVPGISISTSPFEKSTHWDQIFLPLLNPIRVQSQDKLEVTIDSDSRYETGIRLMWCTRVLNKKQPVQIMDTAIGMA